MSPHLCGEFFCIFSNFFSVYIAENVEPKIRIHGFSDSCREFCRQNSRSPVPPHPCGEIFFKIFYLHCRKRGTENPSPWIFGFLPRILQAKFSLSCTATSVWRFFFDKNSIYIAQNRISFAINICRKKLDSCKENFL